MNTEKQKTLEDFQNEQAIRVGYTGWDAVSDFNEMFHITELAAELYTTYRAEKAWKEAHESIAKARMKVLGRHEGMKFVPSHAPMGMFNEQTAKSNHNQSLARLNERGGLGVTEMLDNIYSRKLSFRGETQEDVDELNRLISEWNALHPIPPYPSTTGG